MTTVYQNLEGGTAGATLTTSDALGTGDTQWNAVSRGTGATLAYSTAQAAHGTQSLLAATGTTSTTSYAQLSVPATTHLYARFYVYLTGKPSGVNLSIARVVNPSDNNAIVTLRVSTGGSLQVVQSASGGQTTTSSQAFPLNTWTRVELEELPASTGGKCTVKVYSGDSTTVLDTLVATANDTELSAGYFRVGVPVAFTSSPVAYFDCIAVSDSTWIGPFIDPANMRTGSASTTGTGTISATGAQAAPNTTNVYGAGAFTIVGGKNVTATATVAATGSGAISTVKGGRTNGPIPAANIQYGSWVDVGPSHAAYTRRVDVATATAFFDALVNAAPGDAIFLADGTYALNDVPSAHYNLYSLDWHRMGFTAMTAGTATNPIIIRGSRNAVITVTGTGSYGLHIRASYYRLEGFRVSGTTKGVVMDNAQFVTLDGVEVDNSQDECVHFRSSSADGTVTRCKIHDSGLGSQAYGEGIYVGSANSNWGASFYTGGPVYGNGPTGQDNSDRILVENSFLYNIAAEGMDCKEATTGGTVRGNRFYNAGYSGANSGDSWIAAKGNNWTYDSNTGAWALADAFQVNMDLVPGWGHYNVFTNNSIDTAGTVPGYLINITPQDQNKSPGNNTIRSDNDATNAALGLTNARIPVDISARGTGTTSAGAGQKTAVATVALTGGSALTAAGTQTGRNVVVPLLSVTGSGSLTTTASKGATGPCTVGGTGTVAPTGTKRAAGTASSAGAGVLTVAGGKGVARTVTLAGTAALTSAGRKATTGAATLSGTATLAISSADHFESGPVALSGAGGLAATGRRAATAALPVTGTVTLTVVGDKGAARTVALTGAATLAAAGRKGRAVAVPLSSATALTALGRKAAAAQAVQVLASGTISLASAAGDQVDLAGAGALVVAGSKGGSWASLYVFSAGTLTVVAGVRDLTIVIGAPGINPMVVGAPADNPLTLAAPTL